jgi:hypothetical protein
MNDDGELILYYGTAKPGDRNFADVVAIDDEIISWLARHKRHVEVSATASAKTGRRGERAAWRSDMRH